MYVKLKNMEKEEEKNKKNKRVIFLNKLKKKTCTKK